MENKYLLKVYQECESRNRGKTEFLDAVREFLESIEEYVNKHPEIERYAVLERLVEPERLIEFRVPWVDDNGIVHVNRGYRVQFNSAIGPYKGGIRLHPSVNQSIIKFLGFEQVLKNSITGLPLGGGKGGSDFDPKGKSEFEIMRFCQSFMTELFRHIGSMVDVPAGDIGTGAREVGYMYGAYKKLVNSFDGAFTGKGLEFGGSLARTEATGYGLVYFTEKMLNILKGETFKDKKVIISGSGNVALYALKKATELGATVIAMSDSDGYVVDENGINFDVLRDIKEGKRLRISEYANRVNTSKYYQGCKGIYSLKTDIFLPCATQNEIDLDTAKTMVKNGVYCVSEGANRPTSNEAAKYFVKNKVLYGPGKAANCGGVMVSGFEMIQNSEREKWTFEYTDNRLKERMEEIYQSINKISNEYGDVYNTILGADILGFEKVANAMIKEGII